jgi:5-methyltetrahydrofolate--homocysteine methyltransferase
MKSFVDEIKKRVLVHDGSKGYMLQRAGLKGGECPESWNIKHENEVKRIYELYKDAGSDVLQTNTFQGNRIQLEKYSLGELTYDINYKVAKLAKEVMADDGFVSGSVGPTGVMFEPFGELTFDKAFEVFEEQIGALVEGGVDVINLETFTDIAEIRAALLAARKFDIPVICSTAYEANGSMLMGTQPFLAGLILKSLGAFMIGANCSFGPGQMLEILKVMSDVPGISLSVKPNAGIPEVIDGNVVYNETPENFAAYTGEFLNLGVRLIGGCCGTTPEFIKAIREKVDISEFPEVNNEKQTKYISSSTRLLRLDSLSNTNIGYIDNGSDDVLIKELDAGNMDAAVDKAMELSSEGFKAVCINIDRANSCERILHKVTESLQTYIKEPVIISTCFSEALDRTLRIYKGITGVLVEDAYEGNKDKILVTAKKYGSTIIKAEVL